jgi:hypothetical protein
VIVCDALKTHELALAAHATSSLQAAGRIASASWKRPSLITRKLLARSRTGMAADRLCERPRRWLEQAVVF